TIFYFTLVPVVSLLAECMVVASLLVLLFLVDPAAATLLALFGGALVLGFYLFFRERMLAIGQMLQDSSGSMVQYAQEGLGAVKEIKVSGREAFFSRAFSVHVDRYARALRRALVIHNFPIHLLESIFIAIFVGILVLLAWTGRSSNAFMLLGVYAAAAFRLIPSLNRIMTAFNRLKQSRPSLTLVMSGLQAGSAPACASASASVSMSFKREIAIRDLHYRYPDSDRDALAGVSLEIRRGEMVGFVGRSGSGKTTLVDCVLGLLVPSSGEILVDGEAIGDCLRAWRSEVGYIPQDIYLTDDSLLKNIALGIDEGEIDQSRVWEALEAAQMAEFVRGLPAGLATTIGERGVRLSGGQRQRIGIARAMYGRPSVLVLDEATSALDHQTEKAIVGTISGLKGLKTILVIAHRLTTIEDCDRVFVLDHGRLVDQAGFREEDAGGASA
ncbi:MAG: ABC transporter ATP-binding protein, partial [Arenimonas sp.]